MISFAIFALAFVITFGEARFLTDNFQAFILLAVNCIAITVLYVGEKFATYLDKELKK